MIRLTQKRESRWIELPDLGVRIKVRPLTTAVVTAAKSEAIKRVAALRKEAEDLAATGYDVDPLAPGYNNPDWRAGAIEQFVAEALLRFAAEEWEGVCDEAGKPLPLGVAAFEAFAAHEPAARGFMQEVFAPLDAVSAEGNGSAPTSPGAGAGAATTAPGAATTDAPPAH